MEQTYSTNTEEKNRIDVNETSQKPLLQLFKERYLAQEEVDLMSESVKKEALKTLGYSPAGSSYLYPRPNQVEECNNPNVGDGLLRRYIFNTNTIIKSLNNNNGIGEPPTKFTK